MSKIKTFFNKKTIAELLIIICAYSLCIVTMFAAPTTTLGGNLNTGAYNLIKEIESIYCGSVAWLLLAINILVLAFSKDEKKIGFAKRALAVVVVAYAVIKILASTTGGGAIGSTVDEMTDWVN